MKKRFMLAAVISCVVISVLSAQQSIEGVLRKFYTGRCRNPKRSPCRCKQNAAEDRFSSCTSTSSAAVTGTIDVIAVMLDPENNLVDILYPGDTVKFLVSTDKDAYIAIIGIDAKGNQYSLPVKDNFLKADMPRTFPDDDVDYQVVDGVFGSEHLFIFAASTPEGLPKPINEGVYQSNTILNATRGMTAVAKRKKLETGVFVIPYTVMKK